MNKKARHHSSSPVSSTRKTSTHSSKTKWILPGVLTLTILFLFFLTRGLSHRYTMTHAEWDEFIKLHPYEAPDPQASRSPCPFLNTFANHGILPRTGLNITYDEYYKVLMIMGAKSQTAIPFVQFAFRAYKELDPSQPMHSDWNLATHIDLHQLGQHNVLEHDISLSRLDVAEQPDFTMPNKDLVLSLVAMADQSSRMVTEQQVSDFRRMKWMEAIQKQSNYHYGLVYQFTGGFECVLLLDFIGRDHEISADHLESFFLKERIPDDWYPMETPLSLFTLVKNVRSCIKSVRKTNS